MAKPPASRAGGDHPRSTGASLSNTAPANYTTERLGNDPGASSTAPGGALELRLLRWGLDSLYLSYRGRLSQQWQQRLEGLKAAALAQAEREQALAAVDIGGHRLEVARKGRGYFPFVLVDNCFNIALSRAEAQALPMAYVQVSSEMLTAIGAEAAEQRLRTIVGTLGQVQSAATLSRADLFVDFVCSAPMDAWSAHAWITRADRIDTHHVQKRFSGWSIGLGGDIGARLYDKTLELEKSRKDYLKPLWCKAGWQDGETVWRLEFQFKRSVLKELGVDRLADLQAHRRGLWRYATQDWLRLAQPPAEDSNQSRWPTHPLWQALAAIDWQAAAGASLSRFRQERIPHDEALFINGLGGLTSFMAREGITDLDEGLGEFLVRAQSFHDQRQRTTGRGFTGYVADKVAVKGKRYNTLRTETAAAQEVEARERDAVATAYREAKEGE